jgi:hypothetical protein
MIRISDNQFMSPELSSHRRRFVPAGALIFKLVQESTSLSCELE